MRSSWCHPHSLRTSAVGSSPYATKRAQSASLKLPLNPTPIPKELSVDSCEVKNRSFYRRVICGEPPAVSAVGSLVGAISALFIGAMAFWLNLNTRKGQVAHDQMRMLLEIDSELMRNPKLWEAHGDRFRMTGMAAPSYPVANSTPVTKRQLELLAFVLRYFNFFDFV